MSFSRAEIEQIFKAFDADNSGQVSKGELVALLTQLFKDAGQAKECSEFLLKLFDTDKSGSLSLQEFSEGTEKYLNK